MTKTKTKPDPELLTYRVALLLVTTGRDAEVAQAIREKPDLGIPADQIDHYLAEARRLIAEIAKVDVDSELGAAILRLRDLYERSVRIQDVKTALATQKEIAKFLDLYGHARARYGHGASGPEETPTAPASPLHGLRIHKSA